MKSNKILVIVAALLLLVGFAFGYFYQSRELVKKDLFIANTVGNNLSEINRLYLLLSRQGLDYRREQAKFNLDMLTLVDCGLFIKNAQSSATDEEVQYFIKGIRDALNALEANGVDRKDLVLCEGRVIELVVNK